MGHLLHEAAIFLAAAVLSVPLFKRLGLGSILGYLAAGALIGPFGVKLITDVENILHFSELGVVLLMFLIGLELEPSRLWTLRRSVFGLGTAQMLATGAVLALVAWLLGLGGPAAIIAGFGLALSSTAIGLQLLAERNEIATGHGRLSFAILLFQDLAVIPLLAIVPLLSDGQTGGGDESALVGAAKALGMLVAVVVAGRLVIRPVFRLVAATRVREVFTAAALLVVIGTALLVSFVGMSMALGAFLAGVLLADSEYRHELEADIEPFKGLLLGLFFIAVGMSADLGLLGTRPLVVVGLALVLMVLKGAVLFALGRLDKLSADSNRVLALALGQGGEFAFVLFTVAAGARVLDKATADLLVVVVSVSMAATPLLLMFNDRVLERWLKKEEARPFDEVDEANQVIIAGFGRYGQVIARILQMARIGFTALEVSPEQVDFIRRFGNKIYYGDASRIDLLRAAKADEAKVFVLAIDDEEASVRTAESVSRHFPNLRIYARARNRRHAYRLLDIGVEVLNRETFLSSAAMAEHVLVALGFERPRAEKVVERFKSYDEDMVRRQHAVWQDEAKLIEAAAQARKELQALFEEDLRAREDEAEAAKETEEA